MATRRVSLILPSAFSFLTSTSQNASSVHTVVAHHSSLLPLCVKPLFQSWKGERISHLGISYLKVFGKCVGRWSKAGSRSLNISSWEAKLIAYWISASRYVHGYLHQVLDKQQADQQYWVYNKCVPKLKSPSALPARLLQYASSFLGHVPRPQLSCTGAKHTLCGLNSGRRKQWLHGDQLGSGCLATPLCNHFWRHNPTFLRVSTTLPISWGWEPPLFMEMR